MSQDGYFHTVMISVVISVLFIISKDAEANKVEFVLTDARGELTETLH